MTVSCRLINPESRAQAVASRRAMVTVLMGEGSNRRSLTRHIVREGMGWVGFNPDETAKGRQKSAESVLATAEIAFATATITNNKVTAEDSKATKEERKKAKRMLGMATTALQEAKDNLARVRREFPLKVEFFF